MPNICFHALVPDAEVAFLEDRFHKLSANLIDAAAAQGFQIKQRLDPCPEEEQLRQVYREEHGDSELEDANVYCIDISVLEPKRSLNEIAMVFARLLTPPADLPSEAAFLENEEAFEIPATYPWMVHVFP